MQKLRDPEKISDLVQRFPFLSQEEKLFILRDFFNHFSSCLHPYGLIRPAFASSTGHLRTPIPEGELHVLSFYYLGCDPQKSLYRMIQSVLPLFYVPNTEMRVLLLKHFKQMVRWQSSPESFRQIHYNDIVDKPEFTSYYRYFIWFENGVYYSLKRQEDEDLFHFSDGSFLQWIQEKEEFKCFNLPEAEYVMFINQEGKQELACLMKGYRQDVYAETKRVEEGLNTAQEILDAYINNVQFFSLLFKNYGVTFMGHFQAVHGENIWFSSPHLFFGEHYQESYTMGSVYSSDLSYPNVGLEGPRDFGNVCLFLDDYCRSYREAFPRIFNKSHQPLFKIQMLTEVILNAIFHGIDLYEKECLSDEQLQEHILSVYSASIHILMGNAPLSDIEPTKSLVKDRWGKVIFQQIIREMKVTAGEYVSLRGGQTILSQKLSGNLSNDFPIPSIGLLNLVWQTGLLLSLNHQYLWELSPSPVPSTAQEIRDYYASCNLYKSLVEAQEFLKSSADSYARINQIKEEAVRQGVIEEYYHRMSLTTLQIKACYLSGEVTEELLEQVSDLSCLDQSVEFSEKLFNQARQMLHQKIYSLCCA